MIEARVALLTNFIPPYRVPVLKRLTERVREFRIFVSTNMESDRLWVGNHAGLPVTIQRSLTLKGVLRHGLGYIDRRDVHIPYDTLFQLIKFHPDVIISGELGVRTTLAMTYAVVTGSKLVIWATLSERTEAARGLLRRALRRALFPRAHRVLVNGESGRRYVQRFGVPPEKVICVPQSSRLVSQKHLYSFFQGGPGRLLYVGYLEQLKGLAPFVAVLSRWCEQHVSRRVVLTVVGEGPVRTQLESMHPPANLSVNLIGNVGYEQVAAYYRAADLFVFPTLGDEWGLVVNEALASGLPVVGSVYSQAVEELVRTGENGWTFAPDEPESMSRALDDALSADEPTLTKMREAAKKSVEWLTPEYTAERILEAITS